MNLIDNGIKKVLEVTPVVKTEEMYFLVKFVDWYGAKKEKKFQDIKNLEDKSWVE